VKPKVFLSEYRRVKQRKPYTIALQLLVLLAMYAFVPSIFALEWGPVGGPDYYDPARHNPFAQDPAFVAPTLDLSGVGTYHFYNPPANDNYFWITMISETYFITARHTAIYLYDDRDVDFYLNNDPVPAETIAFDDTYYALLGDDLFIGRLKSAPSSAVKRYPLIKRPDGTNYAGIDDIDLKLFIVGARTGEWGVAQSRVGLNDISQHYGGDLYYSYDFNQRGVDEVRTLCCDSSAPSFVANHYTSYAVAGIHSDSRDANVSSFASAIAAEVSSSSGGAESVTVVSDLAGDLNADFSVNLSDWTVLSSNLGNGPGMRYIDGDINGDGYVDYYDFREFKLNFDKTLLAPADFNEDFAVDKTDMLIIGNHWHMSVASSADGDASGDGYVDGKDFDLLNAAYLYSPWTAPHTTSPAPGDLTEDGLIDNDDSNIVLACITSGCSPQDFERSDINNDGFVDTSDLQIVLASWDPNGPADVNDDLKINNDDIAVLFNHWGAATTVGKAEGDLNLDGVVDIDDYVIITNWWGRGVSDFSTQEPLGQIPEPSTTLLALFGGATICALRTRRRDKDHQSGALRGL
jgi:hypothetical protein